jgi:hypothetical protein
MLFTIILGGCVGPPALRTTVLNYDMITNQLEQELMLLNIARAHRMVAPHFTVTGSIAATFDFTTTAGAGGRFAESPGFDFLDLNWGASASENPTFQIIPISGKEFTKRLVNPLPEEAFATLVFQGIDIQLGMRLMAAGIEVQDRDGLFQRFIANNPQSPELYMEFRRIAMHLSGLWKSQQLFVRDLPFDEVVIDGLKQQPKAEDLWKAKGLNWWLNPDGTWKVTRNTIGRTLISNYDPLRLTNSERYQLNELAKKNAGNYVMVDIRPGYPGGDFPLFGAIKLRSYFNILVFVGRGIERVEEFDVKKDPRTPGVMALNPRKTLSINVTEQPPPPDVPKVFFMGKYYSLADSYWDRRCFIVLSLLFQITVTDVSQVGIPITISK